MRSKLLLLVAVFALLVGGFAAPARAEEEMAQIRVAHLSSDAPAVDVYVNGEKALENIPFNRVTPFMDVAAGTYSVAVVPTGEAIDKAVIGPVDLEFAAGSMTTVAAIGRLADKTFAPLVIPSEMMEMGEGMEAGAMMKSNLTIVHGVSDAPAVDVFANGTKVLEGVTFGQFAVLPMEAGTAEIKVTAAGDETTVVYENAAALTLAGTMDLFVLAGDMTAITPISAVYSPLTITEFAVANSTMTGPVNFGTLVAAVTAAELGEALMAEGPFTVFAPLDSAFAAVPAADLQALLADKAALTNVLTYHVVEGMVPSWDVVAAITADKSLTATALNGKEFTIAPGEGGALFINGNVPLVATDVFTKNGVIHVIGAVMMPPM
jgi:uncharacterized surface protein with fasciclin (FAS1) repeats